MRRGSRLAHWLTLIVAAVLGLLVANAALAFTTKPGEPAVYTVPPDMSQGGFGSNVNQPSILVIGDSLTVGPFGEFLQGFLQRRISFNKLFICASCGSSPENWLSSTPEFITPCGFRYFSGKKYFLTKYRDGKKPQKVPTPKIPQILGRFKPRIVIIQQGTNWMDELMKQRDPSGSEYKENIRAFIREIRSRGQVQIIWILPYDSSKYSAAVKDSVDRWIKECARELNFQTIDSRAITSRYIPGKSGGDGVHLSEAAAREWAVAVIKRLQRLVPSLR